MITVSFQGELGAYSEEAARSFFGDEIKPVPQPSFAEALELTASSKTDRTILPVENSIEGSVGESYALLYSTSLKVIGETYHHIKHFLIGTGSLEDVDTVYSHPQALGQCRNFLQAHHIKAIPAYDTAGSVGIIQKIDRPNVACIASQHASATYGIPTIQGDIADDSNNTTRFLILARHSCEACAPHKTSIVFSLRHEPGSLQRVLQKFYECGTNLTKIESRPKKDTRWEYNFFVDFEGSTTQDILEEIRDCTTFLRVLGTYPAATTRT